MFAGGTSFSVRQCRSRQRHGCPTHIGPPGRLLRRRLAASALLPVKLRVGWGARGPRFEARFTAAQIPEIERTRSHRDVGDHCRGRLDRGFEYRGSQWMGTGRREKITAAARADGAEDPQPLERQELSQWGEAGTIHDQLLRLDP